MKNGWFDINDLLNKCNNTTNIFARFDRMGYGRTYGTLVLCKRRALEEHLGLEFVIKGDVIRIDYKDLKKMSDEDLFKYYDERRMKLC